MNSAMFGFWVFFKCFFNNLAFSQTFWVGISKAFAAVLPPLPLQSHWPDAASADFRGLPQASKAARWDGRWVLWKTDSLFFPLFLRFMCKHKHRRMRSSSFSDALYLASLGMILLLVSAEQLCQPKVCDFHVLRGLNEDVSGSKVTVHQATLLQIVHSLQYDRPWVGTTCFGLGHANELPNLRFSVVTVCTPP